MKKEHAELLLEKGSVRIGTLHKFRNEEIHGEEIGDNEEGKKSSFMNINNETWSAGNQPEFTKSFFNIGGKGRLNISNVGLVKSQNSPDLFVFCTTSSFDEEAMKNFGYDACIEITRPDRFFKCLSKKLKRKGAFVGNHKCIYQPRMSPHYKSNNLHPALIKELKYSYQKEVRSIWEPYSKNIEPLIITAQDLNKHCTLKICL